MQQRILDTGGYHAVVRARHGFMIYNKNDRFIGQAVERYGEFCELEFELFRQFVRAGHVVVEVGANVGTHTLPLAKSVGNEGHIVAFEPQRVVFQMLCGNLALNHIENVDCRPFAVGATAGDRKLPFVRYDQTGNFGGVQVGDYNEGYTVPCVTLDEYLDVARLDFLKVDVEGMESEVLTGSRQLIEQYRPILYVENDRLDRSPDLIELIASLGYRMYWHLPPLFNPNNYFRDPTNLYPNLQSANMLCLHRDSPINLEGFDEVVDPHFHPHRPPENA